MKLPTFPFKKKDESNYYLSLLLNDEKVHAVIFQEIAGKINIVGEHQINLPQSIDTISQEHLLTVLDKTISSAEKTLPENVETQKTIFGVKETWIEDTKIKKDYLAKLKKLCDELDLSPIGFLVIHEAIAHLLEKEEGAPPSAVLVEIGNKDIAVSIIKAGKILETKRKTIEESLAKTIDKTLHFFTNYEILPSRIILFNSETHEKTSQELISHHWSKSLPFLHVPQITVLTKHFDARAILSGAATQMGFELTEIATPKKEKTVQEESFEKAEKESEAAEIKDEEETIEDSLQASSHENFGFLEDTDISDVPEAEGPKTEEPLTTFPIKEPVIEQYTNEFFRQEHETPATPTKTRQKKSFVPNFSTIFASLHLQELRQKLHISLPPLSKKRGIIFLPPAILGILLVLFLLYIFLLQATVTILVTPKTTEKEKQVTFATGVATDFASGKIKAEEVTTSETGSVSTPATGTKEIGDKAKGQITLYSRFTEEKTISAGTVITSSNNLAFTLDSSVTLSSSSADASSPPTTAKVNVTAKNIGKEYNLPSATHFTVSSFSTSDIVAKNDNAYSGGSKKDITVVSKNDIAKLLTALPKNLEQKAKDNMNKKISSDQVPLSFILSETVEKKTFSKDAGEEASSVTLDGTVTYTSLSYNKNDAKDFGTKLITDDSKDLQPTADGFSFSVSNQKAKDDSVIGTFHAKASLLPIIDEEKLAKEVAGKSFTDVKTQLLTLPQAQDIIITLHPGLPFLPALLPRESKHIKIVIKTNG